MKLISLIFLCLFSRAQSEPSSVIGTYMFSGKIEVVSPQGAVLPADAQVQLARRYSQLKYKFYQPLAPLKLVWDMSFLKQWIGDQKVLIFTPDAEFYFPEVTYLWQQQKYSVIPGRDTFANQEHRLTFSTDPNQLTLNRTEMIQIGSEIRRFTLQIWFEKSEDPDLFSDTGFFVQ